MRIAVFGTGDFRFCKFVCSLIAKCILPQFCPTARFGKPGGLVIERGPFAAGNKASIVAAGRGAKDSGLIK